MATSAQQQVEQARNMHRTVSNKKSSVLPTELAEADRAAALALAGSNLELATAITRLTEALGKNQTELGRTVAGLAAKVAELAKR